MFNNTNSADYKDRYSPASHISDWSDVYHMHHSSRGNGEDTFPDTDTEDAPSTEYPLKAFPLNDENYGYQRQNPAPSQVKEGRQGSSFSHQVFKCRQLPCRTFISTGSCPYGDRCVFLHDPQIESKPVYIKTKVCIFIKFFCP